MPPKDERTSRWQACFGETTDWEEDSEGEGFWFKSPLKITTKNPMGHWWLARGQIENVKAGRGLGKGRSGGYATEIGFVKGSDQIVFKGFQGGGILCMLVLCEQRRENGLGQLVTTINTWITF